MTELKITIKEKDSWEDENGCDDIEEMKRRLCKLELLVDRQSRAIIMLQKNDNIVRNAISHLQSFMFGLFKKIISKWTEERESNVKLMEFFKLNTVMCNDPNHLEPFKMNAANKYSGSTPTCQTCLSIKKASQSKNRVDLDEA